MSRDDGWWEYDDHAAYQARRRENFEYEPYVRACLEEAVDVFKTNKVAGFTIADQVLSSHHWVRSGKPYVKVFPHMADVMSRTKLSIPCEAVKMPLPSFAIRLPKGDANPLRDENMTVRSILVSVPFTLDVDSPALSVPRTDAKMISLAMDTGGSIQVDGYDYKTFEYVGIGLDLPTLEDSLARTSGKGQQPDTGDLYGGRMKVTDLSRVGVYPSEDLLRRVLALSACCIFFLTNQHERVMPDVHPRYVQRWKRIGSPKTAEELTAKTDRREMREILNGSKRLGSGGAVIHEIDLPRTVYVGGGSRGDALVGKRHELQYRHDRAGHGAWRWIGPRDKPDLKWVFIEPTTVRKDLPARPVPITHGYRIA